MGSELVNNLFPAYGGGSGVEPASVSYVEIFKQHLPYYLAIGVTYEQYWNEDCTLVKYYREAFEIKKRIRNQELWLQGKYFYDALIEVSPILRAFAKNGSTPEPYTSEPYPLSEKELQEKKEREAKAKYDSIKAKMLAAQKQINSTKKGG